MLLNVHHLKVEIINHVMQIVIKVILIVIMVLVLHHLDNIVIVILIGSGAASPGQQCYCYTDTGAALSGLKRGLITKDDIECTPLEGGDYKSCNANCYKGNSDCYY
eukprot:382607_1